MFGASFDFLDIEKCRVRCAECASTPHCQLNSISRLAIRTRNQLNDIINYAG